MFVATNVVQSSELGEASAALHVLEAATHQGIDVEIRLDNETVVDTLKKIVRGEGIEYEKGGFLNTLMRRTSLRGRYPKKTKGAM